MAGQELRLLDIAADAGREMGVWRELHGTPGPAALSDQIKGWSARCYGTAGPAFVERLIRSRPEALAQAKETIAAFLARTRRVDDSGQVQRGATRFAAIAAAGELAAAFNIVPWREGWATDAAEVLFERWAHAFGRDSSREEQEVLRRLRGVIQSERAMFAPVGDHDTSEAAEPSAHGRDGEARSLKTYGFRHVRGPEVRYLFHDEGWAHVFSGFNGQEAARVVQRAGFLETDAEGSRLKKKMSIRGEKHRLYCVHAAILEASLGD